MISAPVFCPQFVGRRPELTFLIERRRELAKAHGGMVLVGGDAGIGKSRLVRAFLDRTGQSRGRVAVGRCRPFAMAPYEPLVELLTTLAPDAAHLIPAQTQDAQLASIARVFLNAAEKHAIVGIIEDLHWSDGGTLAVLALLGERLATSRMLLVGTYRANELGPEHPHYAALGALLRNRTVASIVLGPLSAADTRDFIDATLRAAPGNVPIEMRRDVANVAEGNPFFTEELLKSVVDREQSRQHDRSLPISVHAAILERMQPLAAADRVILTQAAVIGRRFDASLLAHTLETDVESVLPVLQRARALQIVEETDEPMTFRFRHALTREAIYDTLLAAQRRPLHGRIARALETRAAWNSSPGALGYHWWAAGDRVKALEYGERSGDAAQALHGYADSIECYERTLGLLEQGERDAARVHAKIGMSYFRCGFMDRSVEHCRQAWTFFEKSNDDAPYLFRLARNLAAALYNDGRAPESIAFFRGAVDTIAGCGNRAVSARARLTFAAYLADAGHVEETRAVLRAVDAETIADDANAAMTFLQATARVCALQGDVAGLRSATERMRAVDERAADPVAMIDALREAGIAALVLGETTIARRCLGRGIEIATAAELTASHGDLLVEIAFERLHSGAYEEARSLVMRAPPMIGEVKISALSFVPAALAVGVALDDRELLAYEPDEEFIERAFATGIPGFYGPLAASCAQLRSARGERDAAQRLLRRAVAATPVERFSFGSFPLAIVAAQQCERTAADDVRALCAATAGCGQAAKHTAELAEAILLHRFGDAARAIAPARAAAAGFAAIGWPWYEALGLAASGDLRAAERIRARIGYRGRDLLVPAAECDSNESAHLPAELTARELDVAKLVARGSTNREIAAALFVSVKLVEKNLSSIYAKLAIRSRSQLTAYMLAADSRGSGRLVNSGR